MLPFPIIRSSNVLRKEHSTMTEREKNILSGLATLLENLQQDKEDGGNRVGSKTIELFRAALAEVIKENK